MLVDTFLLIQCSQWRSEILPNSNSLMSLAAWIPSSLRFFSICLLRAREARSSALMAQPMMMVCMGCRASLLDQDMINSGHGSLVSLTCVDQCCSLCHHSPRTNHQSAAAQSVGAQSVLLAAAGSGSHTLLRWLLLHSLAASDQTRIFSDHEFLSSMLLVKKPTKNSSIQG